MYLPAAGVTLVEILLLKTHFDVHFILRGGGLSFCSKIQISAIMTVECMSPYDT